MKWPTHYKHILFQTAFQKRIPLTATIEIIGNCNFRCVHCYINNEHRQDMLTYDEVVCFGEQIISRGCLFVTLTGGEVLLHPDFEKIYMFFIKKGLAVSVFTNGSLICDKHVALFVKYPPKVIEITVYGASEERYSIVTRTNTFLKVKNNILQLKRNHINVLVKIFILKENADDFQAIYDFAKQNEIPFKYDAMIISRAESREMKHQLDNKRVLEIQRQNASIVDNEDAIMYDAMVKARAHKLFQCGGGRHTCWLKSNNRLRACNFLEKPEYDMNLYTFDDAWCDMQSYLDVDLPLNSPCLRCKFRDYCDLCPAKVLVMYNSLDMAHCPPIYCKIAEQRYLMNVELKQVNEK